MAHAPTSQPRDTGRTFPVTWSRSDRTLARLVAKPVQAFLNVEAAGGIVLVAAAAVALLWASSPWRGSYDAVFHTDIALQIGSFELKDTFSHWINDGLMVLFFFVVGLEIKREWVSGELRDRRAAALPAIAAVGGMVVPAAVFVAVNLGGSGSHGWGIAMATDIAFAVGVLALLGSRVPTPLKVFLLTLAIVDDVGAIVVIALFYSDGISFPWLGGAVVIAGLIFALQRVRVRAHVVYVALGAALWFTTYESGVHATIAGVVLALLTPATAFLGEDAAEEVVDQLEGRTDLTANDVREVGFLISESVPLTDRLETMLHPWTSFVVLPLFALANAGIDLGGPGFTSPTAVSIGVVAGLVLGKTIGITFGSWLAVRSGLGRMPKGVRPTQLLGVAMLGGIGFTVSIFVAGLAYDDVERLEHAKAGIVIASILAAVIGSLVLLASTSKSGGGEGEGEASADDDGELDLPAGRDPLPAGASGV